MGKSILVFKVGSYYSLSSIEDIEMYDAMERDLTKEEGTSLYGFKLIEGKRNISDEKFETEFEKSSELVKKLNRE